MGAHWLTVPEEALGTQLVQILASIALDMPSMSNFSITRLFQPHRE